MNPAEPGGFRSAACRYRTVGQVELYLGDAHRVLKRMPDASVDCVATSAFHDEALARLAPHLPAAAGGGPGG